MSLTAGSRRTPPEAALGESGTRANGWPNLPPDFSSLRDDVRAEILQAQRFVPAESSLVGGLYAHERRCPELYGPISEDVRRSLEQEAAADGRGAGTDVETFLDEIE